MSLKFLLKSILIHLKMEFVKYFAVSSSNTPSVKPKDDISDVLPFEMVRHINLNSCFNLRPNKDIICLNREKFKKVINVLSSFSQFDFLNKFKPVMGSELLNMINNVTCHKIIIPENCMSMFIIYLIFEKYNSTFDEEFIKLFDFIHIERYFEQIKENLNIISLSEFIILLKSDNWNTHMQYKLPIYLLNKGEKLLYNPSNFNLSCLKKALVNDNFDLAYKLVSLNCNLYENEKSFKDSALFYAMYFRNKPTDFNGIFEISDKQWMIIKLILSRCKTFNYQIDPVCLRINSNPVYRVNCSIPAKPKSIFEKIEFEREGIKACNPLAYALFGYSPNKLEFILKSHPEFFEEIKKYNDIYTTLTQRYMRFV